MVSATITLIGLRIPVPRIAGRITKSASDGTVYSSPATLIVIVRPVVVRLASQPSGIASSSPSTTGGSANARCSTISPPIISRLPSTQAMGAPRSRGCFRAPGGGQRPQHVVGADRADQRAVGVDGDALAGGRGQRRVEGAAQRPGRHVVERAAGNQVVDGDRAGAAPLQPALRLAPLVEHQ